MTSKTFLLQGCRQDTGPTMGIPYLHIGDDISLSDRFAETFSGEVIFFLSDLRFSFRPICNSSPVLSSEGELLRPDEKCPETDNLNTIISTRQILDILRAIERMENITGYCIFNRQIFNNSVATVIRKTNILVIFNVFMKYYALISS